MSSAMSSNMLLALALALNLAASGGRAGGSWSVIERFSAPTLSLYQLRTDGEAIYWISCPGLMKACSLNRLVANEKEPTVVTADFEPGGVYAVDRDGVYMTTEGRIVRLPKSGGRPTVVARVEGWIKDLQIVRESIYVSTADTYGMTGRNPNPRHGTILRFPKAGGAIKKITETESSDPIMAIDDRRIYFVGEGSIQSVPVDGGRIETLARDDANPAMSIAADRDAIYFAAGGEVRRVPKTGGAVSVVYRARIVLKVRVQNGLVYASRNLAFDRGGIAETAAIVRIPSSGGNAEVIMAPSESPQDMAVDRAGVFVLLSSLGEKSHPDRIVALEPHEP
jgi:hypothetical protein